MKLEEYLTRPANEANQAILEAEVPKRPAARVDAGELSDNEREWLKRLRGEPGWPILAKVLQNIVLRHEHYARMQSQEDPLGNRDKVASLWAYAAIARELSAGLVSEVEMEIARLGDANQDS